MAPVATAKRDTSVNPDELDTALQGLLEYCRHHKIYIAPSIAPRRAPGRGVGIYATRPIKSGQKLMSVPIKSLITSKSIPGGFFSAQTGNDMNTDTESGDELAVHAKLAAYFAFGGDELRNHERWMATWPKWEDFTSGMPVFWDNAIEIALSQSQASPSQRKDEHDRKRRKLERGLLENGESLTIDIDDSGIQALPSTDRPWIRSPFIRSPALDGAWQAAYRPIDSEANLVTTMTSKITKHILSLTPYFPQLSAASSLPVPKDTLHGSTALQQFLYAWALINTRCFYYHPPNTGAPAPSDPNECMALCPGMDLFNHSSDTENCRVKYDGGGFSVTARRNYNPGDEVLLSYGAHPNDTLWVEYGFFLATPATTAAADDDNNNEDDAARNHWDEVSLDALLLPTLSIIQRHLLTQHGYIGAYTLKGAGPNGNDGGVCYRTVMLAHLKVLGTGSVMQAVLAGEQDLDMLPQDTKDAVDKQICDWMKQVLRAARENLKELKMSKDQSLVRWLGGSVLDDPPTGQEKVEMGKHRVDSARLRRDMCVRRWEQIQQMANKALELYEGE